MKSAQSRNRTMRLILAITVIASGTVFSVQALTNRSTVSLNADWRFYKGNASGASAKAFNDSASGWSVVQVPHVFEYMTYNPKNSFYQGMGTYRKRFTASAAWAGKKIYCTFAGAQSTAKVWVNGVSVGDHYFGWTQFTFDITQHVTPGSADNVITVFVDNTPSIDVPGTENAASGTPPDFVVNGGIHRDVYLTITDKLHIPDPVFAGDAGGGIFVTYPQVSTGSATLALKTWVKNESGEAANTTVQWTLLDASGKSAGTAQGAQTVSQSATTLFQGTLTVSNPSLWSPSNPYRYTMRVEVLRNGSSLADDYEEKIGIRSIKFESAKGFSINGASLKLFGVNRHEMWPFIGLGVPYNLQLFDALLLKQGGCNFLRLSHYPQSPTFLDLCDSLGILIYEESPGGSNNKGGTAPYSSAWDTRAKQSMREMVRRDRNRPSVICWGTLNEPSQSTTWEGQTNTLLHDLDETRPTTMSRNYATANNVYDVYAHNSFTDLPGSNPDSKTIGYINSEHTGHRFPTKRDTVEQRLIEHAEKHEFMTEAARSRGWVAGGAGWCGFDYNSGISASINSNSNIKFHGICDLMRIPKPAYYFYMSQRDNSNPMVQIVNHWLPNSPLKVKVYSNCDQVRLSTWNGSDWATLATQGPDGGKTLAHPPFTFTLANHNSERLRAEGLIGGAVKATHIVRQPLTPNRLILQAGPTAVAANGSDMSRILISIADVNGTVCPYATATITVSVSGPGKLIGDNPITASNQAATNQCGSFGILVQSQLYAPGTITVTATSTNLASGSTTVASVLSTTPVAISREVAAIPKLASEMLEVNSLPGSGSKIVVRCKVPENTDAVLQVFDTRGRLVAIIADKKSAAGSFHAIWDAEPFGPGVYCLRLETGENIRIKMMPIQF